MGVARANQMNGEGGFLGAEWPHVQVMYLLHTRLSQLKTLHGLQIDVIGNGLQAEL